MNIWVVFTFLIIMNVAMSICAQVFMWTYVFISPDYVPRSKIISYMITLLIKKNCQLFSKLLHNFKLPLAVNESSASLHPC